MNKLDDIGEDLGDINTNAKVSSVEHTLSKLQFLRGCSSGQKGSNIDMFQAIDGAVAQKGVAAVRKELEDACSSAHEAIAEFEIEPLQKQELRKTLMDTFHRIDKYLDGKDSSGA